MPALRLLAVTAVLSPAAFAAASAYAVPPPPGAKPFEILRIAGGGNFQNLIGSVPAKDVALSDPRGIAVDASGNAYIADTGNNVIRKVTPAGKTTVVAGTGAPGNSGDGGSAVLAKLNHPEGVAVEGGGTLFIADTYNNEIRVVRSGKISRYAGTGAAGYNGDNIDPLQAQLNHPFAVLPDSFGGVFIADTDNDRVRRAGPSFQFAGAAHAGRRPSDQPSNLRIFTYAGGAEIPGWGDGNSATDAKLDQPTGLAMNSNDDLFIADTGESAIRKVDSTSQVISTAMLSPYPRGVAVDSDDDIIVSDPEANRVLIQRPGFKPRAFAGTGAAGHSGDGGLSTLAQLDHPTGVAVDAYGDAFIADSGNDRAREVVVPRAPRFTVANPPDTARKTFVYPFRAEGVSQPKFSLGGEPGWLKINATTGTVTGDIPASTTSFHFRVVATNSVGSTTAGPFTVVIPTPYHFSGKSKSGALKSPQGMSLYGDQLLIADRVANRVQTYYGDSLTTAGTFPAMSGTAPGEFNHPDWTAYSSSTGRFFVSDEDNNRVDVFAFNSDHVFVSLGSIGHLGTGNGALHHPHGLAISPAGNLYVADTVNDRVVEFTQSGTWLRNIGKTGTKVGQFKAPTGLAFSDLGLLLVADFGNHRVQALTNTGKYVSHVGKLGTGLGEFKRPYGIAVSEGGDIFVTDQTADRVEEFSNIGQAVNQFGKEGTGNGELHFPTGIVVQPDGVVSISDTGNQRLVNFTAPGAPRFGPTTPPLSVQAGTTYTYGFVTTADPKATYQLTPGSAAFLHINPNTGVLTGAVPSDGLTSFSYGVLASSPLGTDTAGPFNITVTPAAPPAPAP